jgi:hypothetical protein
MQKSLPGNTTVEIVNDTDSDAYENVDISEGDDICETEESESSSDNSSGDIVLQTTGQRLEVNLWHKLKHVISKYKLGWKRKVPV